MTESRHQEPRGESTSIDLKLDFDPSSPKAWLDLIKDVVAISNAGGGIIRFGENEINSPGLDRRVVDALDSSDITSKVESAVSPGRVILAHTVSPIGEDRFIVDIVIEPSLEKPLIITRTGNYQSDNRKSKTVYAPGDIFVRHGTSNRKISYDDMEICLRRAANNERERLNQMFDRMVQLPPGVEPIFELPSGAAVPGPLMILELFRTRRERDRSAMLTYDDLLFVFIERSGIELEHEDIELLIRAGLRRPGTLYFWLAELPDLSVVSELLFSSLNDTDRDVSDAAKTMLEVAALTIENDAELDLLVQAMSNHGRYMHFRDVARDWGGRSAALSGFDDRVESALLPNGLPVAQLSNEQIEHEADTLVEQLIHDGRRNPSLSRRLSDFGRVIFSRKIGRVTLPRAS